ncbi:cytochrome P450 [Mycena rosella]|uniref:Cytochrome P450 n=1 Tax=Mycena rosella TaxID=1033263 RepID=A0AAD7AWR3_MYCRO|nr:cytochrome P450 [Mycena rosella]
MNNQSPRSLFTIRRRTHRRHCHHELNAVASRRFQSLELQQAHDLLRRILNNPDAYDEHYDYVFGGLMITMAYGLDILPHDDPYINAAHAALRVMGEAAVPGRFLIDVIPALKYVPSWFPGASFKRKAANGIERPIVHRKQANVSCRKKDEASQELDIKHVAATFNPFTTAQTRGILVIFLRAMMENPTAQRMAQREIDTIIRPGHLPGFEDQDQLSYITALVKETIRWWPVAPMDTYRGYRIPAKSVVMVNAW